MAQESDLAKWGKTFAASTSVMATKVGGVDSSRGGSALGRQFIPQINHLLVVSCGHDKVKGSGPDSFCINF